jgi:hypothetical protein
MDEAVKSIPPDREVDAEYTDIAFVSSRLPYGATPQVNMSINLVALKR